MTPFREILNFQKRSPFLLKLKILLAGAGFTKPENEEDESTPLDLAVQAGHGHLVKLVEELSKFWF